MRFFLLTRREKFDVPWSRVTNRKCLLILVILYFSVALTTFLVWSFRGVNQITGDEPPFLVMTSGLVRHGTFEQTLAYADQAKTHEIYEALCPETRMVGLGQGGQHTVRGPHGLYSKHGIGLPLLLAIPFALYGVLGAKIFMIILGSGIVITSWKISGLFSETRITRFLSVLAAAIGMPLLPGSNQIYTDIPAGLISGRFQWAAAMVFLIPTIFGLNILSLKTPKAFHTTVAIGMLVQACYFWQYARGYVFLYNRSASTLAEDYTIFHRHMHIYQWLPMLYNEHVAFKYLPNITWLIALSTLAVAGFVLGNRPSFPSVKLLCGLGAFCFLLIIPSGSMVKAYGSRAPARNESTRLAVSQRAQAG